MDRITRTGVTLAYPLVGWAVCGAIMGVGRATTSLDTTLTIHAIAVPIVFGLLSRSYFTRFGFTTSFQTALIFTGLAITLDAVLVAPVFERSYAMFGSILGTWLPFALIFASRYLVGMSARRPLRASLRPS
jgi:uncharacterized membrane protein YhdT